MDTIKCLDCGLVNMSSDSTCERCQAPLPKNVPSYVKPDRPIELSPEERRRIYEEEKAKLEAEQSAIKLPEIEPTVVHQTKHSPPISYSYQLGMAIEQLRAAPELRKYGLIALSIVGVGLILFLYLQSGTDRSTSTFDPYSLGPTPVASQSAQSVNSAVMAQRAASPIPQVKPTPQVESDPVRDLMLAVNKDITYEHLKKNADKYTGQPWAFTGKILQIQESGGVTAALVSLDSWGNKLVHVTAGFTTEFVEKNQVYVVGYLAGNYSYKSVAGWDMTVPEIAARAILKPGEAAKIRGRK